MPNFTISRNLESGLLLRQSGQFVRALANKPLSSVGDGMRFPLLVQNVFRDSEPATNPGQGTRTNLSYVANTFATFQLDGNVVLDNDGGSRNVEYSNTANLADGNYTIALLARNADGSAVLSGSQTPTDIDRSYTIRTGSVNNNIGTVIRDEVINGITFKVEQYVNSGGSVSHGIRKNAAFNTSPLSVSAIMIVSGHVDITLADYLRTTGSAVTGLFPEVSQNIGAWEDITFLMEVELPSDIPSAANRLFNWGNNNTNSVRGIYSANGFVTLQYLDGGSVIFELTTNPVVQTGVKRIAMKVSSGNFRLYINGVLIGSNTSVFTPTNYDPLKLGANLTGTGNRLQGAWFREFNIVPFMSDADAQAWTQP
jgi:hypothetical protein